MKEHQKLTELKNDVRRTHFHMGNNVTDYASSGKQAMIEHPITANAIQLNDAHLRTQKDRMRRANFQLPYTQSKILEESTYKQCISDMVEPNSLNEGKPLPMKNLKQSSIKIGGPSNMLSCISE